MHLRIHNSRDYCHFGTHILTPRTLTHSHITITTRKANVLMGTTCVRKIYIIHNQLFFCVCVRTHKKNPPIVFLSNIHYMLALVRPLDCTSIADLLRVSCAPRSTNIKISVDNLFLKQFALIIYTKHRTSFSVFFFKVFFAC